MTRIERFWIWFAWRLPRPLAYWATIRVVTATYSDEDDRTPCDVNALDALKAWSGAR